ncbi:phosphoribosyl transferase domain protein [Cordyceps javanica]|nr:phosphoribosyl transferase domain protein [Cordyceps javanica]
MYGMNPQRQFVEHALGMLTQRLDAMVVIFHRSTSLNVEGLVCQQTACFPSGVMSVPDEDKSLDSFARFISGSDYQNSDSHDALKSAWRKVCHNLCFRDDTRPDHLSFNAPTVMMTFTRHATALDDLATAVPLGEASHIKNRQARRRRTAVVAKPAELSHVRRCVCWALKHRVSLAVIGGGHGGHCLQPNVVSIDMAAFNSVDLVHSKDHGVSGSDLVVAGAGCRSEDIIRTALAAGLTVPLGSRPSVGAGLWLHGGIGHLSRLHGLACDSIVGAVMVCVASGRVMAIGNVPIQFQPSDAFRPDNEEELLWALKGAGTNFGIVISVVFKACASVNYNIRQWTAPVRSQSEARQRLADLDILASELPRENSADLFLYSDSDGIHVSVSMAECTMATPGAVTTVTSAAPAFLGPEDGSKTVNAIDAYDTEMYMSSIHGGPDGRKTSSFKRCIFLKRIGQASVMDPLLAAIDTRPSSLCYLHLLHAGGAVADIASHGTAFGCRDWTFACVITGVWYRDQDASASERAAVNWVYDVANKLLPLSTGAYGADLGPDPRDEPLAAQAFGQNRYRLAYLKRRQDPHSVLSYACPFACPQPNQQLIILVTGRHGVGKDFCAAIWASIIGNHVYAGKDKLRVQVVSISDATKAEYAAVTGADQDRLLRDRAYKEEHRPALTKFFSEQLRQRPKLKEDHFLQVVCDAAGVDVLIITGMREREPVAALSHLVPNTRLIEVRITTSNEAWHARQCLLEGDKGDFEEPSNSNEWVPSLYFHNEEAGNSAAESFAKNFLLRYLHPDVQKLKNMVRIVPNFPRLGIDFRHVLDIAQQPGGLQLCTSLLRAHFPGKWAGVDAIACCEAGGFPFASPLAASLDTRLVIFREGGKLPPPTTSVAKSPSHISSSSSSSSSSLSPSSSDGPRIATIEADCTILRQCRSVVVVDDALASGKTVCAMLRLLCEAGITPERISVMVVAEFPFHRGREFLRQHGFEKVAIGSLLVFGGA